MPHSVATSDEDKDAEEAPASPHSVDASEEVPATPPHGSAKMTLGEKLTVLDYFHSRSGANGNARMTVRWVQANSKKLFRNKFFGRNGFSRWMKDFFGRNGFSLRRVTGRNKNMLNKEEIMNVVRDFHLDMRAFQLSEMNDPVWGFANPAAVCNRDEVPIEIASLGSTVDDIGVNVVLDTVGKDSDLKRFCTAALTLPMRAIRDPDDPTRWLNLHPLHCIFSNQFCRGEDYTGVEGGPV